LRRGSGIFSRSPAYFGPGETFEKRPLLVKFKEGEIKFKEGENFNHRNTFSILRIEI